MTGNGVRTLFMVDTTVQFRFAMNMHELGALLSAFTYGKIKVDKGRLTLISGNTRLVQATIPLDGIYEPNFPKEIITMCNGLFGYIGNL